MRYILPDKLPTTVVGSYPRFPEAKKALKLKKDRYSNKEIIEELIRSAIRRVVEDYLEAGIDIISDGEQRREDMAVFFAENIEGFKISGWVRVFDNVYYRKPIIAGRIKWTHEITVKDWKFASTISRGRPVKVTLTGPYTMYDWSYDEYYGDKKEAILDLANALRKEVEHLIVAGAKYIQIDEPALSTHAEREDIEIEKEALEIIFQGINAKRIVHICYGKLERLFPDILDFPVDQFDLEMKNSNFRLLSILKEYSYDKELGLGVIDVHNTRIESVDEIMKDIMKGLEIVPPEKLYVKPDCGLKRLPRNVALAKLKNMVIAAKKVREELQ